MNKKDGIFLATVLMSETELRKKMGELTFNTTAEALIEKDSLDFNSVFMKRFQYLDCLYEKCIPCPEKK